MKNAIGHFLRILSILFFIILIAQLYNLLFIKEVDNPEPGYKAGYYFGSFLVLALFFWLSYKLFKYGGKLIASKNVTNQVDEIGKDNI